MLWLLVETHASDFPTLAGAFDPTYNGSWDGFVAKLNPIGTELTYGTYLGGIGDDRGLVIVVDGTNAAYVSGDTWSNDFPTTPGAFDRNLDGSSDVFIAKLDATGSYLHYGSYIGGSNNEMGGGIAVDTYGNAYLAGSSNSDDFPTQQGTFDPSRNGYWDTVVFKLNAIGDDLVYGTYLGGAEDDFGSALAVDAVGNAFVTGETYSDDFPTTPGSFDPDFNEGERDAFVVAVNSTGTGLGYATYLGGNGYDQGTAITMGATGQAIVTGKTGSADFPTSDGAFDTSYNGNTDAFISMLGASGSDLAYGTFLGGSYADDWGYGIALDAVGKAHLGGRTDSFDFPTSPDAYDPSFNGGSDVFVATLFLPCCDFDGDGTIDVDDLVIIANLWGMEASLPYDRDGDGLITIVDIQRAARWWGTTVS